MSVEEFGEEIVRCSKECNGVRNERAEGYYPRAFFLFPESTPPVNALIIGENPGHANLLEREFYKALAERNPDKTATWKDCERVWKSIAAEHKYYQWPLHLLEELRLGLNGVLWAELAFCESDPKKGAIDEAFKSCSDHFLPKIARLLPNRKYVFCLGEKTSTYVRKLPDFHRWKVIHLYHPTKRSEAGKFASYFEKEGKKKVTERRLKERILKQFEKRESNYIESYEFTLADYVDFAATGIF